MNSHAQNTKEKSPTYDVVVYGGTAAGVIASVAAARQGLSVALIEPRTHLGGMVSGGLGRTDFGRKECIGGMSLEFFKRVGKHYDEPISWYFEPHVAEDTFEQMLAETSVTVIRNHRLREGTGVRKENGAIAAITAENGNEFRGRVFIDCSYEGDVMAQAGVNYTWGRESGAQYGESLAGVREHTPKHQFKVNVPARDSNGNLLAEISDKPKGEPGEGDRRVQAYNFRLCMTQRPDLITSWPKPANYDPARYALLAKLIAVTAAETTPAKVADLMHPAIVKNGKTDTNNNGAFSTDYIGKNYDYPEGDYETRERIWQDHKDYVMGMMYFLANDPQVPEDLRAEMNTWGLAKDEFTDNGNWPHQLYVREARRMVGEHVMTQKDIQEERTKPDAIGMGSYNSDSHNVQRFENAQGFAENEGDMQVPVKPYQIPYGTILPRRGECANLLVPVCCSASHVAYSTVRMEPVFMITAEAAAVAAKMAIEAGKAVQDIDRADLTARLLDRGAVLEWVPPQPEKATKTTSPPKTAK
jgi:hypothetical protein